MLLASQTVNSPALLGSTVNSLIGLAAVAAACWTLWKYVVKPWQDHREINRVMRAEVYGTKNPTTGEDIPSLRTVVNGQTEKVSEVSSAVAALTATVGTLATAVEASTAQAQVLDTSMSGLSVRLDESVRSLTSQMASLHERLVTVEDRTTQVLATRSDLEQIKAIPGLMSELSSLREKYAALAAHVAAGPSTQVINSTDAGDRQRIDRLIAALESALPTVTGDNQKEEQS